MKRYTVFFDFDNTITTRDVFDDMLVQFSDDERWVELERKWKDGRIGSRECLEGQMKSIRITKTGLDRYLAKIKIDPYFKRLVKLFEAREAKTIILSDNFDYILENILKNNGIRGLKIYSNNLKFVNDRLFPHFPFRGDNGCSTCAHCKKSNLLANHVKGTVPVYIGDGLSDACPAQHTDLVFAKEELLKCLKDKKKPAIPYNNLKEVYSYFKTLR